MRNLLLRRIRIRPSSPAKVLLALIALILFISLPPNHHRPTSHLDTQAHLETVSPQSLVEAYDHVRLDELSRKGFNATTAARSIRAPLTLPSGLETFNPSTEKYLKRLKDYSTRYLGKTSTQTREGIQNAIENLENRIPPFNPRDFPRKIWSTDRQGLQGVNKGFELWSKLLPLPLSPSLLKPLLVNGGGGNEMISAKEGAEWKVEMADDEGIDRFMTSWIGERVVGDGEWGRLWGKLGFGVLRADVFRYMSMLVCGGVYADSDTSPIAHPYLWGIGAENILHPDLQYLIPHLKQRFGYTNNRRNPRSEPPTEVDYIPPYSIKRRAPFIGQSSNDLSSILNPDISMVIAIEWDSWIAWDLHRFTLWSPMRFRRSWRDGGDGRSLQIAQYAMLAKPYHPILIDTMATIAELIQKPDMGNLGAIELTGPGPFTDAVLRYLLIQYGITPNDLRNLRGPVQIGDIIILQEEALLSPESSIRRLLSHVKTALAASVPSPFGRMNPWVWGKGFENWRNGGVKVVYHGLAGSWKGQGWNQ